MTFSIPEFFAFCPVLSEMIQTQTARGRSGKRFEGLGALSSVNNLVTLRQLGLALQPGRSLEIGLSFGGSCLALAASHRDLGSPARRQHVAIDPFQKQVWDDTGLLALDKAGLSGYVDFRASFSGLELPRLLSAGEGFSLVYIDGSHLFEDVFVDFFFVARLLIESGVVVFDDSSDPNVRKVLNFIRRNLGAAFTEVDLAAYRADGGTSLKYRVAKALGKTQMTAFKRIGDPIRSWNAPFFDF
jgi:predicted O-methyltransferase YrrM